MREADAIFGYFPTLTERQRRQIEEMKPIYEEWNSRINVVSRKDFDSFYVHHVLHSLAIARFCSFAPGAEIIDVGCGGGFPSVPLAVLFPDSRFTAVDSIAKKIRVVDEVCAALDIRNIRTVNRRVETLDGKFDYIVSRAVTDMTSFLKLTSGLCRHSTMAGSMPSGIIYLKGGDLDAELERTGRKWVRKPIGDYFREEYFSTKQIVYSEL